MTDIHTAALTEREACATLADQIAALYEQYGKQDRRPLDERLAFRRDALTCRDIAQRIRQRNGI